MAVLNQAVLKWLFLKIREIENGGLSRRSCHAAP
jgi:hypothetical protein